MSWSYQIWKQDDDVFYGYITPLKSAEYDQFDVTEIFCCFKIDSQFYGYPHTIYGVAPSFDVSKVYHYFECNDSFYGYPAALGITFNPLGAFMRCTSLRHITIPESVYEFGSHSFYESGLDAVTISPDSIIYQNTFNSDCTISYYPSATNIPQTFDLARYQKTDIQSIYPNASININNKIERELKNVICNADTSQVSSEYKQASITGRYTGATITTFNYTVHEDIIDITSYNWEQGTGNPSTGEFNSDGTTRIRCLDYINVDSKYGKVSVRALNQSDANLSFVVYYYTDSSFIYSTTWLTSGTWVKIPDGTTRIRILLKIQDNVDITVADMKSCKIIL